MQALLAQDYLLLRVQDAEIALLRDTVAGYERSLTLTRNQYAAGIVARGDVAQAEAQLASTQAQEQDAMIQRAQLEHAIAVLVGKPPAELSIAPKPLVAVFPQIPVTVPSELLERRPDIAAAERRTASANAEIGVAQAAFYPALSLGAIGGVQSSAIGSLLSLPARYWSIGPSIAQTIFDAGLRQAQKEQAIATYDETVANYRDDRAHRLPGSRGQPRGAVDPRARGRRCRTPRSRRRANRRRSRATSTRPERRPISPSSCCRRRRSTASAPRSASSRAA